MFKKMLTVTMLGTSLFLAGCGSNESKTTDTRTIETPSGTTTIQTEKKVETTGTNPPAVRP